MKIVKETSNVRKLELIQRICLSNSELMELASCGYRSAIQIRKEISESIRPLVLPNRIPTKLVIEHLRIDVEFLLRLTGINNHVQIGDSNEKVFKTTST